MLFVSKRCYLLATVAAFSLGYVEAHAQTSPTPSASSTSPTTPDPVTTSAPAAAGNAVPTSPSDTNVAEVVVTGSRIRRPNLVSSSPLVAVNSQELKYEGTTNVENLLNNLPQVTADETEAQSNGATGTANVDLRNLGSNRTLVLIDGRRLMPGDPRSPAADLNIIPSTLVDRVDIVTGGASAVYGSDAVAGVVNFILKKDYQGVQVDSQFGFAEHDNTDALARATVAAAGYTEPSSTVADGFTTDVNIIAGTNIADGKGNITGYLGYRYLEPVNQSTRDYSACAIGITGTAHDQFKCIGSSNSPNGIIDPVTGPAVGKALADNPDGTSTFVPYTSALSYNTSPLNYIQRDDVRYTGGGFAHYQLNPLVDLYGSLMFMDDDTRSQVAPSGYFQGVTYTLNCNNPLMSASQAATLCGPAAGTSSTISALVGNRFTGTGSSPRIDDLRHTDYRINVGARGDLGHGWSYDAYLQYSEVIYAENYMNDVDTAKGANALQVVSVNGVPTCQSVVNGLDPSCVPANIFKLNGISPAAYNYLYAPTFTEGTTTEQVASASLSGDLTTYGLTSPFATQGVGVALGSEYRRESLDYRVDAINIQNGNLPASGSFDVSELYGEAEAPLVQNAPFIKSLSLDGGYRFSDYSSAGATNTYKGEIQYSPTRDIRFRGSYNRAVRAPNILELYAGQAVGNTELQDPCSGASPTASLAACERTGVTPAQYGNIVACPSALCDAQGGGNANLKPEKADTLTGGFILTPRFVPGLALTLDYFNIKVNNVIGTVGPSIIVSQCIQTGSPYYCNLFHRDPGSGVLFGTNGYVVNTNLNTGYYQTSGVDLDGDYHFTLSNVGMGGFQLGRVGDFDLNMIGTYTNSLKTEPLPGLGTYNCAGLYGPTCGQPVPTWRHRLRGTWTMPWAPVTLSLNWRYIGRVGLDSNTANSFLTSGTYLVADNHIPEYNYFDLAMTWQIKKGLMFRAGVNNVADKDPPIIDSSTFGLLGTFGNGNTFPGVYDSLGRTIFFGLTADL